MSGARYVEPLTVSEAVAALAENNGARCLAGGQTLVAMMNAGLIAPPLVVGLRRVAELKGIEFDNAGSFVIGAMVTHAAFARAPVVQRPCGVARSGGGHRPSGDPQYGNSRRCAVTCRSECRLSGGSPGRGRGDRGRGPRRPATSPRPISSWIF